MTILKTIVVIGGGITGLSTVYYLEKIKKAFNLPINFILVEESTTLGGKIQTTKMSEFIMETGADSIVARKENVASLLDELHLHDEIVYNETGKSFLYLNNQLKQIPDDTVFGIPTSKEALFSSELISEAGKLAALKDFDTVNTTFTKDSSVGEFLTYFLGEEIVEKQIGPVLSGVYSGKLNELTLASTLPYLLDYKNQYGSIIRGLSENKQKFQTKNNKKFISFKYGLSTLIDRIEEQLTDTTILKGVKATKIRKRENQYTISFDNHEKIEADFVVLSVPHQAAKQMLQDDELDQHFQHFINASLISVYLGFDIPDEKLPKDGTGFIVPNNSGLNCHACTWTSRKWKHTSENQQLLLRLFYKSTDPVQYEYLNSLNKDKLIQVALKDVEKSIGIKGEPISANITKWQKQMPTYHLKHQETVNKLNAALTKKYPNILLAGCSYYGVGIADCMTNGNNIAYQIKEKIMNT